MFYGFAILVINEFIQKEFNLKSYILHAPRTDLISANKEGLISLPGYVAIQLIGIGLGRDIYQTLLFDEPSKLQKELKTKEGMEKRKYSEIKALLKMVTYCILFFIASELSYDAFDTPSRRLCNMSWIMYQLWILQVTHTVIFACDRFMLEGTNVNIAVDAIQLNQFWLFLCSNLVCGLINLTFETLHVDFPTSIGLMYVYCSWCPIFFGILLYYNIKLNL